MLAGSHRLLQVRLVGLALFSVSLNNGALSFGSSSYGRLKYTLSASGSGFTASTLNIHVNGPVGAWVDPGFGGPPEDITQTLHFTMPEASITSSLVDIGLPSNEEWRAVHDKIGNFGSLW